MFALQFELKASELYTYKFIFPARAIKIATTLGRMQNNSLRNDF
jgi:hypothetical protein